MHALILTSSSPDASLDLARPIAGAPLLARQLEYLRANGVVHVVVNRVADEPAPPSLRGEALNVGAGITWIPSAEPLGRLELARRAGLEGASAVVLAHGRLSNVDLREATALACASGDDVVVGEAPHVIEVWHVGKEPRAGRRVESPGWILDVLDEASAQAIAEGVLLGTRAGIEVRGSEIFSGVWAGRGAVLSRGARVEAPSYLGPDSFVADGAEIGPGAILGAGTVVESGARVVHARVADGVVVGRGLDVSHGHLGAGVLTPHGGAPIPLDDELLVGARRSSTIPSRLAAAAALGFVGPAALAFGGRATVMARRLARVASGSATWLGVRGADPDAAVLDVEAMLVPRDARDEERAAARALYRSTKSASFDARLLLARVVRGGGAR